MLTRSVSIALRTAASVPLMCIVFAGCHEQRAVTTAPATASVAQAQRRDISNTLTVAGEFQPYQEVELHAKVSGYIRKINVDIGDRVRRGQIIATLEVPELSAQVVAAQAQVRHSQSEIARAQNNVNLAQANHIALHAAFTRLYEASKQRPGLIAEQELDDARAKDQDAEARIGVTKSSLDAAKEQLGISQAEGQRVQSLKDYSVVTAPFNGVVTMRYADVGSLIQAGTASNTQSMPVVQVAQSDLLRLRMPIPEVDVPFIRIGGDVTIKVQSTGKVMEGKIVRFTRELNSSTRTMLAEVDIPNTDLALSTGMTAEVTIVLQEQKDALSVPAGAIVKAADGSSYVLAVNAANRVEKVPVVLGIQSPDRAQITHGLQDRQLVIVSAQANYEPGQIVVPKQSAIGMPHEGGAL